MITYKQLTDSEVIAEQTKTIRELNAKLFMSRRRNRDLVIWNRIHVTLVIILGILLTYNVVSG